MPPNSREICNPLDRSVPPVRALVDIRSLQNVMEEDMLAGHGHQAVRAPCKLCCPQSTGENWQLVIVIKVSF